MSERSRTATNSDQAGARSLKSSLCSDKRHPLLSNAFSHLHSRVGQQDLQDTSSWVHGPHQIIRCVFANAFNFTTNSAPNACWAHRLKVRASCRDKSHNLSEPVEHLQKGGRTFEMTAVPCLGNKILQVTMRRILLSNLLPWSR